jgi:hypothetical protein
MFSMWWRLQKVNRPKGHSGRGRHRLGKQTGSLDRDLRRRQVYSATFLHLANRLNGWSQKLDHWGGFRPSRRQLDFLGQGAMWGAGLGGRGPSKSPSRECAGGRAPGARPPRAAGSSGGLGRGEDPGQASGGQTSLSRVFMGGHGQPRAFFLWVM